MDSCRPAAAMTRERFQAYIDAFNRSDPAYGDYYDPDVVLIIAGKTELRGPKTIHEFYTQVKSQTRRTIQVNRYIGTPDRIAVELQSEFLALEDVPDFTAGAMKTGDRIFINTFVHYELKEGRFARIRSAVFRKVVTPAPAAG